MTGRVDNTPMTQRRTEPASFCQFFRKSSLPSRRLAGAPTRKLIESKIAVQPWPSGDWARKPTRAPEVSPRLRLTHQLPVGAVFRGVEGPGPAGPGDPQPERAARGREGIAVVRYAVGDHRHRGGAALRGELVAELRPATIGQVDEQQTASKTSPNFTVTRAANVKSWSPGSPVSQPASGRAPSSPHRVDEHVRLRPAGQRQRPAPRRPPRRPGFPDGSRGKGRPGRYKSVTGEVSHRLAP